MLNDLIASIYLSINIGFSKVFIFGMDHSWHSTFKEIRIMFQYYYDNFYKSNKELILYMLMRLLHLYSVSDCLKNSGKFIMYVRLNEYAKFMNVNLYNCGGSGSLLMP